MKYATLILGAALLLASIITVRADTLFECAYRGEKIELIIEEIYSPTCPASTPPEQCLSVKFDGYKISGVPNYGVDIRIKTKTPRRGVSTSGPEIAAVTVGGKPCRFGD